MGKYNFPTLEDLFVDRNLSYLEITLQKELPSYFLK